MPDKLVVRIERCDGPGQASRWEEFRVERRPNANVISVLMQIQREPVTAEGRKTSPPAWDAACLEEVCGSCTMVINGKVRQACSALIDHLTEPITLSPMKKFPLVRDLAVDRQRMFEALKRVKAWIPVDGTYDLGPGPRQASEEQELRYVLSTCMTCGCCLEVCPQITPSSAFVGAAALSQVRLFNMHPTGAMNAGERLHGLMGEGGVGDCGKAGNCVIACPKGIPLTSSIADMARKTTLQAVKDWFFRDERKGGAGPAG
ncbi:MAG TPA: succinate dehydrogenase iron-sulfur subunit [Myxococcales bacterium]|nr:succinate dehydrogenase iron-sulfur subunit [Myxococcales bacterium]